MPKRKGRALAITGWVFIVFASLALLAIVVNGTERDSTTDASVVAKFRELGHTLSDGVVGNLDTHSATAWGADLPSVLLVCAAVPQHRCVSAV